MSEKEREVIEFLAKVTPWSKADVEWFFVQCGKDFAKTEQALHLAHSHGSRDVGVRLVMGHKKATLWDTLKADLEAEARGKNLSGQEKGFKETNKSHRAAEFLERMRRMEDRS